MYQVPLVICISVYLLQGHTCSLILHVRHKQANLKLHCKKLWVTLTIFRSQQLHSFCGCDIKFKMIFKCVVMKLPTFSISFQKAYKSAFLVKFVASVMLHIALGEFLGCMILAPKCQECSQISLLMKELS